MDVQYFVDLEVQNSWQVQYFVELEMRIAWQVQYSVDLEALGTPSIATRSKAPTRAPGIATRRGPILREFWGT